MQYTEKSHQILLFSTWVLLKSCLKLTSAFDYAFGQLAVACKLLYVFADILMLTQMMYKVHMNAGAKRKSLYGLYVCAGNNSLAKTRGLSSCNTHKPYNNLHIAY